jgi:Ca2+:H+ antiporter
VGIAPGSAVQIAPFVAPVLVLFSYVIGQTPMDLQSWRSAVAMTVIAAILRPSSPTAAAPLGSSGL